MALLPGEIFIPETAAQIRELYLSDLRLEAQKYNIEDPPTTPGTDNYIRGTALANQILLLYSSLAIRDAQRKLSEATGEDLDQIREDYGLPEVPASPGAGNVIIKVNGTTSIPDGTELTFPNNKRAKVVGLQQGVVTDSSIPVIGIDKGADTNLSEGVLKFVAPPLNVSVEVTVDPAIPITGGFDEEDDERKRARILNKLQNPPAGGNWSHVVEISLNTTPAVQYAFVYPALGGPGSEKVVLVNEYNSSYSRAPALGVLLDVETAIRNNLPTENLIVVTGPDDTPINVAIKASLPSAATSDNGWSNLNVWPPIVTADLGIVTVEVVTSSSNITVSANTTVPPEDNITEIMWWDNTNKLFVRSKVISHSGSAGAWVISLETPLTGVAVNDYISPSMENGADYAITWIGALNKLGPGENTADVHRISFAFRHPSLDESWPATISAVQLTELVNNHSEISSIDYNYISQSAPIVPTLVADPPQILTVGRFAIYKA